MNNFDRTGRQQIDKYTAGCFFLYFLYFRFRHIISLVIRRARSVDYSDWLAGVLCGKVNAPDILKVCILLTTGGFSYPTHSKLPPCFWLFLCLYTFFLIKTYSRRLLISTDGGQTWTPRTFALSRSPTAPTQAGMTAALLILTAPLVVFHLRRPPPVCLSQTFIS